MRKIFEIVMMLFILVSFVGVGLAEEYTTEEKKAVKLEEIVVTATKTEKKLIDVPASVTVITAKDIEDSGAKTVADVLRTVPGVDVGVYGASSKYFMVNMRGFADCHGGYVKLLIDGIPANDISGYVDQDVLINLENVERIEVVRGPASALYGDNAMGGVINIITKKGTPTPETKLGISYGSFDSKEFTISTRGTKDRFGYSANFKREQEDSGYIDDTDWRNTVFNLGSDFEVDDVSALGLTFGFSKFNDRFANGLTREQLHEDRKQNVSHYLETEEERYRLGLRYERELSPSSRFSAAGYFRHSDATSWISWGGGMEWIIDERNIGGTFQYGWKGKIFDHGNHLILGFDTRWDDSESPVYWIDQSKNRIAPYQDKDFKRKTFAPYIQNEFTILDPLTLTLGARYDSIKTEWKDKLTSTDGDTTDSNISPKVGLVYKLSDTLSMYINYAETFLSPSVDKLSHSEGLDPEDATSYEIGLKGTLSKIFTYEITYYNMEVKDRIVAEYHPDWSYEYKNIGKTEAQGVEFGGELFLFEGLTIPISYTYTRSKYKDYIYDDYDPITWEIIPVDCENKYVVMVPEHKVNIGLKYQHPLGLTASLTGKWVDDMYIDPMNRITLDGHITFDAKLSYNWKSWSCYLLGNNIFGKKYCDAAYYDGAGVGKYYPMDEGYFMGGISYKF